MNNRYLPSLIIAVKGIMAIGLGILFKITHLEEANLLLGIGGGLIVVSLIILLIMQSKKPKNP